MIALSKSQDQIVTSSLDQSIQVLAAAGSGKTRVLTERIRYILNNTNRENILALTFTNKAAEEMKARLQDVPDIDERCYIGTIHSFAQRILEQYAGTIGLSVDLNIYEREQDLRSILIQTLNEIGEGVSLLFGEHEEQNQKEIDRRIRTLLEAFSCIKRELMAESDVSSTYGDNPDVWALFNSYQQTLLRSGGIDFDDILAYAYQILLTQEWCAEIYRDKFRFTCVDEAQDLNKIQYEFIKILCKTSTRSLLMVGDPNQMIYGFNGSSHSYLTESFLGDFHPLHFSLKENFRSSRAVIDLANRLKPSSQVASDYVVQGRSDFTSHADEESEAEFVCTSIRSIVDLGVHDEIEDPITWDKIVVLARNRFIFSSIEKKLKSHGIPYNLKKGERSAEPSSFFGKILDLGIRIKINPKDWVDGRKIFALLNVTYPEPWNSDGIFDRLIECTNGSIPFPSVISELLRQLNIIDIDQPNVPKFCQNLKHELAKYTSHQDDTRELELAVLELKEFEDNWGLFRSKRLGSSLSAFQNAVNLGQLIDDSTAQGVTLSTVHTMKGLEKDIVFLIHLCEGVFPDYRAKSSRQMEEELNNAFVAVTRARRWIYISYPKSRTMPWGDTRAQAASLFWRMMTEE